MLINWLLNFVLYWIDICQIFGKLIDGDKMLKSNIWYDSCAHVCVAKTGSIGLRRRRGCGARGVSSAKWGLTGRVHAFCGAVSLARAADRTHRSRRPRESRRRNLQWAYLFALIYVHDRVPIKWARSACVVSESGHAGTPCKGLALNSLAGWSFALQRTQRGSYGTILASPTRPRDKLFAEIILRNI